MENLRLVRNQSIQHHVKKPLKPRVGTGLVSRVAMCSAIIPRESSFLPYSGPPHPSQKPLLQLARRHFRHIDIFTVLSLKNSPCLLHAYKNVDVKMMLLCLLMTWSRAAVCCTQKTDLRLCNWPIGIEYSAKNLRDEGCSSSVVALAEADHPRCSAVVYELVGLENRGRLVDDRSLLRLSDSS